MHSLIPVPHIPSAITAEAEKDGVCDLALLAQHQKRGDF